jgi:DNA gyrase subunit B
MATKSTKAKVNYTAANIKTLVFPDSVRRNASQYIGGTDSYGLWMVVKELLDNGLDEALAGRNTAVLLHVDKDGSFWVQDAGHGIPQGITKTTIHVNGKDVVNKMPTMQSVFGALHTSGKYDNTAYEVSIGTHGIGAKGTNATAEFFTVWTCYEGQWYTVGFKKGKLVTPVAKCKAPKGPNGQVAKRGTLIHVKPDLSIFSTDKFPGQLAVEWAEIMSYFNPGVAILISTPKGKRQFLSKTGVVEYVHKRLEKFGVGAERVMFEYKSEHGDPNACDVVVAFSGYTECDLRGFTNGSHNSKGGKHVDSVIAALYDGLRPFIKTRKVKKKDILAFSAADLKEGLVGIVNAKLHKAKFNSQDKVYLSDERMGTDLRKKLVAATTKFFKENKAMAQRICDKATKIAELKNKFTISKAAASKLNAVKRGGLPAKYASFDPRVKISDRELFLVEGDSAGGTAKEARFPYQAILPLKGKIKNALKDPKGTATSSDEIIYILAAMGFDPKAADAYSKLTMGKLILLADPDPDGPFIGETKIRIMQQRSMDGVSWHEMSPTRIDELLDQQFRVPVFHDGKEIWADATARLERNVDQLVALDLGKAKYKVSLEHRWVCLKTEAMYGRDTTEFPGSDDLVYVKAKDLKVGDRVYCPAASGTKDRSSCDYRTRLGFAPVSKMRIQQLDQPVPVYCLTVPRYHHFVLPSGVVSSNCHINSLCLSLIYKHVPGLFERGMVYVADSPEFYAEYKESLVTGSTLSEVQAKLKKLKAPASTTINHVKGWGELDASLMRIMAMDPQTRRLIQIKALEQDDHVDFVRLMNEDVQYRRKAFGLPENAVGGEEEDDGEGSKKKGRVAAKKVPARKVSTRTTETKKVASKVAEKKRNISRLGPLSDAIREVAATKRRVRNIEA